MRGVLITMPNFNGVGAGQTATVNLPADGTYKKLDLRYTPGGTAANQATMEADIEEIRLRIEGKTVRTYTAAELNKINATYGKTFKAGHLPIYFAEPWREGATQVEAYAWGMADITSFQVEVDIAAGATAPRLAMEAIWSSARQNMGVIKKTRRYNLSVTATGDNTWNPPKEEAITAFHFQTTDISNIKVLRDNEERVNVSPESVHERLDDNGLTAQAGWTQVIFDATGDLPDALPMKKPDGSPVQDLRVTLTMSAATSHNILMETIGLRD
ncbi:major capsid protein P2 [Pyruvatibacter mobilis]|uniref:major capsid protein P2 n=1 Tax=Pyruvatibacter mobilis TaxID=1712261 RepID=UPI003D0EDB1B